MTPLPTERLRLREASPDDAPFVLRLINEPGWHRFINDPGVRTLEQARQWMEGRLLKSYRELGFGFWLVERRSNPDSQKGYIRGVLEGLWGVYLLIATGENSDRNAPGVARRLMVAEGQGYASEAARACIAHARDGLGWTELLAITSPDNPRSAALLRKLGFADRGLKDVEGYNGPSRLWHLEL